MATFVKINDWVETMCESANCGSDQFVVALSNTAPGSESTPPTGDGAGVIANVTQVSYTNCSSRNITTSAAIEASGTYKVTFTDLVLTASGGGIGPFRYVYIYDDTTTSPADALLCYFDYASSITVNDGETFTLDFSAASGIFTVA
jgi:hypothetical protein